MFLYLFLVCLYENLFLVLCGLAVSNSSRAPFRWMDIRRKLAKLVTDHILSDGHLIVRFAVVDHELEPDKVGQDDGGPCLCLDRRNALAGFRPDDGETECDEVR